MSLAMTGSEITIREKLLVPGDFVSYQIAYVTDVWLGEPVVEQPDPILLQVDGAKQFGGDPHKETLDKITNALGSLMERKAAVTKPSAESLPFRDRLV